MIEFNSNNIMQSKPKLEMGPDRSPIDSLALKNDLPSEADQKSGFSQALSAIQATEKSVSPSLVVSEGSSKQGTAGQLPEKSLAPAFDKTSENIKDQGIGGSKDDPKPYSDALSLSQQGIGQVNSLPFPSVATTYAEGTRSETKPQSFDRAMIQSPIAGQSSPALIQQPIASPNTGAVATGLKPWSGRWVMGETPFEFTQPQNSSDLASDSSTRSSMTAGKESDLRGVDFNSAVEASDPLSQTLGAQLQELNGEIDAEGGNALVKGASAQLSSPKRKLSLAKSSGGLSGAEFLSTRYVTRQQEQGNESELKNIEKPYFLYQSYLTNPEVLRNKKGAIDSRLESLDQNKSLKLDQSGVSLQSNPLLGGVGGSKGWDPALVSQKSTVTVPGHITQGGMGQARLTSESIIGVAQAIRSLGSQGHGEMRIKLKPENLGELHVRVITQGNEVGLQIRANDEQAKKIIEDSVSHLKDNLASHQLNLNQVDVSLVQSTQERGSAAWDGNAFQSPFSRGSDMHFAQSGFQSSAQHSNQGGYSQNQESRMNLVREGNAVKQPGFSRGSLSGIPRTGNISGRVDVIA